MSKSVIVALRKVKFIVAGSNANHGESDGQGYEEEKGHAASQKTSGRNSSRGIPVNAETAGTRANGTLSHWLTAPLVIFNAFANRVTFPLIEINLANSFDNALED